ncbi:hypothetical protein HDU91_003769 [Kappamyces sp. JEL0680]|nr:hypothetical protein HDU91_003769 [Kappamyces sp. JEL0680]
MQLWQEIANYFVRFDNLLRSVIGNPNDANFQTWKKNKVFEVCQWLLIVVSLTDFTVYTLNFIYGVWLALKEARGWAKVSTVAVGLSFLVARFFYLPFLLILIPISNVPTMPMVIYEVTLVVLVLFYVFLLLMPLGFALRWVVKFRLWRSYSAANLAKAESRVAKRVEKGRIANIIVNMPIYNEEPEALIMAVESVVNSCYPKQRITVYLSFDNDEEDELVKALFRYLTGHETQAGGWRKCTRLKYKNVTFVVNLFPHGGKRNTQALTFKQMAKDFRGRELDSFVLYLDSDIVLHKDAMLEFLRAMEQNKGLIGMTGFISAISSRQVNFLQYFQDCEYVMGQIIARSLEAGLGGVTCLPGALTIIRLKEMAEAAQTYFDDLPTEKIFDFHRYHLGEDRFLTHLLMQQSKSYSLGFCPSARAKTVAPDNWTSFVKQRRRWLLGAFSNEIFFLADLSLWKKVPLLLLYKILDFSSRSASFFIYLVTFQIITGVNFSPIQSLVIWAPLALAWLFLGVVALSMRRLKSWIMFPFIILLNPWLYFGINLYSLWTWNTRSWGGPRTDVPEDELTEGSDDLQPLSEVYARPSTDSFLSEAMDPAPGVERTRSYLSEGSSIHSVEEFVERPTLTRFYQSLLRRQQQDPYSQSQRPLGGDDYIKQQYVHSVPQNVATAPEPVYQPTYHQYSGQAYPIASRQSVQPQYKYFPRNHDQ